jgi:hypothetical protein
LSTFSDSAAWSFNPLSMTNVFEVYLPVRGTAACAEQIELIATQRTELKILFFMKRLLSIMVYYGHT